MSPNTPDNRLASVSIRDVKKKHLIPVKVADMQQRGWDVQKYVLSCVSISKDKKHILVMSDKL